VGHAITLEKLNKSRCKWNLPLENASKMVLREAAELGVTMEYALDAEHSKVTFWITDDARVVPDRCGNSYANCKYTIDEVRLFAWGPRRIANYIVMLWQDGADHMQMQGLPDALMPFWGISEEDFEIYHGLK